MSPAPIHRNTLFYGDNLDILRRYIPTESIDLIYLDPPFNSNRSYNVLFKDESGKEADAQITAFDDSWHWGESAQNLYEELIQGASPSVSTMIGSLRQFIGTNQMMAYLVMMTARLQELYRVLKPTGSLYLHCDPTASHYLKVVLDTIFGAMNFRNEIIWKRRTGSSSAVHQSNKYGVCTDTILFYVKSANAKLNAQYNMDAPGYREYIEKFFRFVDENGRRYRIADLSNPAPRPNLMYEYKGYKPPRNGWAISKEKMEQWDREGRLYFPPDPNGRIQRKRFLDELQGKPVQNLWDDIEMISSQSAERLGYPTQKPLELLERIINASSNKGDVVLDPFSGCGTAIAAAQKLGRRWIGIDITHLAIAMHKNRLKGNFLLEPCKDYDVIGEPEDLEGARQLAKDDRYQFQWWALSLIQARPVGGGEDGKGKKGKDTGIDGVIQFLDDANGKPKRAVVQVKSGHVKSGDIRDLRGVLEREKDVALAVFITLEKASADMLKEAVQAGSYTSQLWQQRYPRIQILTVEEILNGASVKMPPPYSAFRQAERVKKVEGVQPELGFDNPPEE